MCRDGDTGTPLRLQLLPTKAELSSQGPRVAYKIENMDVWGICSRIPAELGVDPETGLANL